MSVSREEERDYGALVKKYFRPFTIEDVAIVPPWEKPVAGKPHIIIDPGMAFGTGRHESTKLMMKCVKGLPMRRKSVLDLGCGSAILSLYARLLGSTHVIGVDIDPDAVFSAAKNLKLNRTRNVYLACADLSLLRGTFDVVLANLDIQTFQRSLRHILQRISPGGHLVVSGIESDHKNAFLALLKPLTPVVTRRMGSWHAFVFKVD
jgi:ribosomal protein L11 methyltransferase